jgi:hypothetical protein
VLDVRFERETQIIRVIRTAILAAGVVWVAAMTFTDPDLWGHVRFGQDIVTAGGLSLRDFYSFTSDRTWINHEWLAEVFMYAAYAAAGPTGLVALKMLLLAGVAACVFAVLRRRNNWRPVDRDFLLIVAFVGMMSRATSVRPQLFSILLFAVLLLVLTIADRRPAALLALPPIFCMWANLHGAFLVGLAVLACWTSVRIWQRPRLWPLLLTTAVLCSAGTLLNPYGRDLWRFLSETVGTSRPEILDWAPVYSHPNLILGYGVVLLTALTALWRVRGRVDAAILVTVTILAVGTFRVSRVDAFFAIAVVMLLGPAFGREPRTSTPHVRWRPWAAATAAVILVSTPVLFAREVTCLDLEEPQPGALMRMLNLPRPTVRTPEREAALQLRQLHGRLLVFFDWGEYAIWHFPNLKVSIDGRRETVYSEQVYQAHLRLYGGASTKLVDQLQPDVIWLPVDFPVVKLLEAEGWHEQFRGPVSVVLVRQAGNRAPSRQPPWAPPERCFPSE